MKGKRKQNEWLTQKMVRQQITFYANLYKVA